MFHKARAHLASRRVCATGTLRLAWDVTRHMALRPAMFMSVGKAAACCTNLRSQGKVHIGPDQDKQMTNAA